MRAANGWSDRNHFLNEGATFLEDAEEGITYKEYLRAFLFLQPEEETTMRTIDRIEENMRLEQNCEKFRADHCVTKCEIRNKVEIFGDLAYTFPSYYGYE